MGGFRFKSVLKKNSFKIFSIKTSFYFLKKNQFYKKKNLINYFIKKIILKIGLFSLTSLLF